MPAIHPARLRRQAALLAEHFSEPPAFMRSLHHLLDTYAERSRRFSVAGEPPPLLQAYNVRPPVLRLIMLELIPRAAEDPHAGLELCDALWEQPMLEFRSLAGELLGRLLCTPAEPILTRLKAWAQPDCEARLLEILFDQGLRCIRQQHPDALVGLAQDWLDAEDLFHQLLALRLLFSLISDPAYENLPAFYRLLQPFTRSVPAPLRPELIADLKALARRSPSETAYFLRQSAAMPESPDTPMLIRQVADSFPAEVEESLRAYTRALAEEARKQK